MKKKHFKFTNVEDRMIYLLKKEDKRVLDHNQRMDENFSKAKVLIQRIEEDKELFSGYYVDDGFNHLRAQLMRYQIAVNVKKTNILITENHKNILDKFSNNYVFKENLTITDAISELKESKKRIGKRAYNKRVQELENLLPAQHLYKGTTWEETKSTIRDVGVVTGNAFLDLMIGGTLGIISYQGFSQGNLEQGFLMLGIGTVVTGILTKGISGTHFTDKYKEPMKTLYADAKYLDTIIEKTK